MTQTASIPKPTLIVVTGRPGSGKSTLAPALARAIRCPAVCRDEIKEGLVHTAGDAGEPDGEIARLAYEAFFDTVKLLLSHRVTLVAEAAFQHKVWAPRLEPLKETANLRIIVCAPDAAVARSRHVHRGLTDPARARFHDDPVVQAAREGRQLPITEYVPPDMGVPTLMVDTANGYDPDFDSIVSFAIDVARR